MGKVSNVVETGDDECLLVGTRQELINFAQSIINSVRNVDENGELAGASVTWGKLDESLTDPLSEIGISSVAITDSSDYRKRIQDSYRT